MSVPETTFGVSPLLAVMVAATSHPIDSVREDSKRAIEASVGVSLVNEAKDSIERLFHPLAADVLEPIVLDHNDVWILAVIQADAVKRNSNGDSKLRVVGSDTIGTSGGVLLNGWSGVERLRRTDANGKIQIHPWGACFPSYIRQWAKQASETSMLHVVISEKKKGFELKIAQSLLQIQQAFEMCGDVSKGIKEFEQKLLSGLQRESFLKPSDTKLDRLGLRVELRMNDVILSSGSPESVMRLTAALTTRGVMILRSSSTFGVMLLGGGEDHIICFRCHDSVQPSWTTANITSEPMIEDALRKTIAKWCGPHSSWGTADFLEKLL